MSGHRRYSPGWDAPRHDQSYGGAAPPSSWRMPQATRQPQGPTPASGGFRADGQGIARNGSFTTLRSPSRASSGFGGVSLPSPNPNTSFDGSETSTASGGGGGNSTSQLIQMAHQLGSAESDNKRLKDDNRFLEDQGNRLRQERDAARREVAVLQAHVARLEQEKQTMQNNGSSAQFNTPEKPPMLPFRQGSSKSDASSNSLIGPSPSQRGFNTPFSPLAKQAHVRKPSGMSAMSATSTPALSQAQLRKEDIQQNFQGFFLRVEQWARQYSLVLPTSPSGDIAIRALKAKCNGICRPRDVDDILNDETLWHFVIAAVINAHVIRFFGCQCLEGFGFDGSSELEVNKHQISQTRPQNPRGLHELLEKRASLYKRALRDPKAIPWLDGHVSSTASDIFEPLKPFIPDEGHGAARTDLGQIVAEASQIGQRMATMPRLWTIESAQPRSRWEVHGTMVQRDPRLAGDPALRESNGFAFVVRLGIAPSITEIDCSSGARSIQTIHPKVVLLMENFNQKTTPQSAEKATRGYGPS